MNHFNVENLEFVMMKRFQCEKELPRKQLLPHKSKNIFKKRAQMKIKKKNIGSIEF